MQAEHTIEPVYLGTQLINSIAVEQDIEQEQTILQLYQILEHLIQLALMLLLNSLVDQAIHKKKSGHDLMFQKSIRAVEINIQLLEAIYKIILLELLQQKTTIGVKRQVDLIQELKQVEMLDTVQIAGTV